MVEPVKKQNVTPTGSENTTSSVTPEQTNETSSISDLGDLLIDHLSQNAENNDFKPVGQNDMDGIETIESVDEESTISTNTTEIETPQTSINLEDIQLEDIPNENETSPESETEKSNVSENNISQETISNDTPSENTSNETLNDLPTEISSKNITTETSSIETEKIPEGAEQVSENKTETAPMVSLQDIKIDLQSVSEQGVENKTEADASSINTDNTQTNIYSEINKSMENNIPTNNTETPIEDIKIDLPPQNTEGKTTEETQSQPIETPSDTEKVEENILSDSTSTEATVTNPIEETLEDKIDNISTDELENIATTEDIHLDPVEMPTQEPIVESNTENGVNTTENSEETVLPETTTQETILQPIEKNTQQNEVTPIIASLPVEETPVEQVIPGPIESTTTPEISPEVNYIPETIPSETIPTENIESKLQNVADQIAGFDLDNLVTPEENKSPYIPDINPNTLVTETTPVVTIPQTITPNTAVPTSNTALQAKNKDLAKKSVLIGLGVIALLGAGYFGYKTFMGSDNPTTPSINTGSTIITGETILVDSGNMLTGDTIFSGDMENIGSGENTSGAIDNSGSTIGTQLSLDQVLQDATTLSSYAKKTLIKATIAKNVGLKVIVFDIQKQANDLVQELANTSDMSTLTSSEEQIQKLTERLDSINTQLDGSMTTQ